MPVIKRQGQFPVKFSFSLSTDQKKALKAASERYQLAEGVIARMAFSAGWDRVLDKLRKQAGKQSGTGDVPIDD